MGQRSIKVFENQEYLASGRWKCSQSPCGAHYWVIHDSLMTCKYCDSSKPIDNRPIIETKTVSE